MRCYSRDDEERIRALRMVREWVQSALLDSEQGEQLEAELRVDLRRTNPFLRAALALFTALIVVAFVMLMMVFDPDDQLAAAVTTGVAALGCLGLAEYLIFRFRVYRFGVEEALAVLAVVLAAISGGTLTSSLRTGIRPLPEVAAALIAAAGALGLYLRFGFVYAALGAMVCIAAIPFQLELPLTAQRGLAAAAIACVLVVVRSKRVQYRDEYPGDEYGWLQAAAVAGVYLVLNCQVPWGWHGPGGWFYWSTYAAIWILPGAALVYAVRDKDRELLDAGLALALLTLLTNRPYLGRPAHTWDPILLGFVLIGVAVAVRRWLASGPGAERHGFTSARLLDRERARLSILGTASAAITPPAGAAARPEPGEPSFRGGRSGGGGAGGGF